ncbi:FAD-binding oxidoreductase [Desulfobotulus mexicanus]|uniref:FAD-binding oxidoreductase n=2 Tax=Desulfobotulus mexicanus TaxID=2586642 RepID=A0A5Q4VGS6_9BACT|nr:FAD-binding oxidoreductase [Desulfobotulus mexicanus]TYT76128.1 FAD-binding oxidoreductase [Desulfobotulus mexicanus]
MAKLVRDHGSTLAFGNGLSYGDSCLALSDQVLHLRHLKRFIFADWERGVLRAEAGVSLEEVLALSIPNGWFLPVTPGTRHVTLGGALANDVHGKNHHVGGTFGCHVKRFCLLRSDGSELICSVDENAALFRATIGGLGLTGIILWVEFSLLAIASRDMNVLNLRFGGLDEFFALSSELDHIHEYTVSWIDCLAKGRNLGRGIFMAGNHAKEGPLLPDTGARPGIPFTFPFSAVNNLTLPWMNRLYYQMASPGRKYISQSYAPFFYPLDSIAEWNRCYGKKGFQQYQCVIPEKEAEHGIRKLLAMISGSATGSFLAVLKRCGNIPSPGLMSFPLPGITLALDFPRRDLNDDLFKKMDALLRETGGRLYPAKDTVMSASDFKHFYPQWEELEALRDSGLCSRFWKRVIS